MSSPGNEGGPAHGRAPRVGADLKTARLDLGWDLQALAEGLRIRAAYLEALEAGRIADLPGNAYALGFLRTYATTLGLDADEMTRRFRAEVAAVNAKTELTFPAPVPERGVPAGAVILLGVVLAVGAYVGWYGLAERAPPGHAVRPLPEHLARLAEPTALAPKPIPALAAAPTTGGTTKPARRSEVASVAPPAATPPALSGQPLDASAVSGSAAPAAGQPAAGVPAAGQPVSAAPVATPPGPAVAAVGGTAGGASVAATGAANQGAGASVSGASPAAPGGQAGGQAGFAAVSALAPPAQAAPVAPARRGTIVVRATAESWVEVKDNTGAVVFTRLMRPGESWTVPREAGLTLTTGNAGGTELLVDGAAAASLGAPGQVERDQPLDPALIKAGALPAQIAAAALPGAPQEIPAVLPQPLVPGAAAGGARAPRGTPQGTPQGTP